MTDFLRQLADNNQPEDEVAKRMSLSNRDSRPHADRSNIHLVFEYDYRWAEKLQLNEFTGELLIDGRPLEDEDVTAISIWLARTYQLSADPKPVWDVILMEAKRHRFHPVRTYLQALEWDGVPRIDTWLHTYLQAGQCELSRVIGRKFLISCVARVFQPGCEVHTTLVLTGPQGAGKTKAAKILGGDWYCGTPMDIHNKDAYQTLRGVWIYEIAELRSFRGKEETAIKAYITNASDRFRPPFQRLMVNWPRQVVFYGTTNEEEILHDATGSRRFWVVPVYECDVEQLQLDRDQLWAEALEAYTAGEQWHFTKEEAQMLATANKLFEADDAWAPAVLTYASERLATNVAEVATNALNMRFSEITKGAEMRIANILKRAGYERIKTRDNVRWVLPNRSA